MSNAQSDDLASWQKFIGVLLFVGAITAAIFLGIRWLRHTDDQYVKTNPYHYIAAYCWPNNEKCQYQDYRGSQPTCPEYYTWQDTGAVVKLEAGTCKVSR